MLFALKSLAFLLAVLLPVYWLGGRVFDQAQADADWRRFRQTFVLVVCVAFIAPSFWIYLAGLLLLLHRATSNVQSPDPSRAILWFTLLLAVPAVPVAIPGFGGIEYFLFISHYRVLSIFLLIPIIVSTEKREIKIRGGLTDWCVIGYVFVQALVIAPDTSATVLIRTVTEYMLETFVPYWAISRAFSNEKQIASALTLFVQVGLVISALAAFEGLKSWGIYDAVTTHWQIEWSLSIFLMRGGLLRAKVAAGHSLILGYYIVNIIGMWLVVYPRNLFDRYVVLTNLVLLAGLYFSLARGSWVGATALILAYTVLGEKPLKNFLIAASVVLAAVVIILATPGLEMLAELLPFIGTTQVDDNVDYRKRLFEVSIDLISQSPWLGFPGYLKYMEDLRQGQGVIDLVNIFLNVALNTGVIGLTFFVGTWATLFPRLWAVRKNCAPGSFGYRLANAIMATVVGSCVVMATISFIGVVPALYSALAGLGVACSQIFGPKREISGWAKAHQPAASHSSGAVV